MTRSTLRGGRSPSLSGRRSELARSLGRYFSNTYSEGRRKFLRTCVEAGVEAQSFPHPTLAGLDGEELAIDCAQFGDPEAPKALIVSCGVHGLEAPAGAATMLQWMAEGKHARLPSDVSVLLIHAVNPFGWAYGSRCDANGVDLNRNCIDWNAPAPDNAAYEDIHELVMAAEPSEAGLRAFSEELKKLISQKGKGFVLHGAAAGQYLHDGGLSYGGAALSWSCETVYKIARNRIASAKQVLFLDWHTGIGPYAEPYFIVDSLQTSEDVRIASKIWPEQKIHGEDALGDNTPDYTGLLSVGLRNAISKSADISMIGMVVEWGTYDVDVMLSALILDNWINRNREIARANSLIELRRRLVEKFVPADPEWRRAVLDKSRPIYDQAIAGLSAWSS